MSEWSCPIEALSSSGVKELRRLQAENDKLRELVRDFYPFAKGRAAKPWLAVRLDRMNELGVEV